MANCPSGTGHGTGARPHCHQGVSSATSGRPPTPRRALKMDMLRECALCPRRARVSARHLWRGAIWLSMHSYADGDVRSGGVRGGCRAL